MTSTEPRAQSATVPCASCSSAVDPLRAARVALFGDRFRYFCSPGCRERYEPFATPLPLPRERPMLELSRSPAPLTAELTEHPSLRELGLVGRERDELSLSVAVAEREPAAVPGARPASDDVAEPTGLGIGSLLLILATAGGGLGIALALAGTSTVALTARLVLSAAAACALAAESWMGSRDESELHPTALLAAPLSSVIVAIAAYASESPSASGAVTLSALIVATTSAGVLLVRRARHATDVERLSIQVELDGPSRRVVGEDVADARSVDLRPGEEIVIESGEVVPIDATVTAGAAIVLPWRGATARSERREGDVIVAGSRVIEGRLRAIVSWAGPDRAWIRLSNDPRRRGDLFSTLARAGRVFAERLAPFFTGAAALAAFASGAGAIEIGILAVSVQAALSAPALATVPALHVMRALLDGLRRGIAFRSAEAFDRAAKVSSLAFCARGTLLLGEPEVADIDAFGEHRPADVLALVAGAESGAQHATATAVLRAARARGVRPDGVRSPTLQPGLGTTAVASNGQSLVVGSRGLMLKEHVSVAAVESRITDLEAMGRSVLLVALGGRLVGLLGLQDGLRPGARASIQHLLDIRVEPVLLSGDARETCEALGRALDIDHIRPEVAPAERGDAIRRLADGGAVVAVVGHSPGDDTALAAADVSIALGAAGSTAAEWSVQLASDDVRDAAFAIRLAHDARREARFSLWVALVPAVLGSLVAALGIGSPALGPLGATLGGSLALLRLRARR